MQTLDGSPHGMRNEITASKRCCVNRPHTQVRLYRLLMASRKFRPIAESANSTKDGLEPFRLIGAARCASRGESHALWQKAISGPYLRHFGTYHRPNLAICREGFILDV